jgi:hypothetical protein
VQVVEEGGLVVDGFEGEVTIPAVQLVVIGVEGGFTLEVQLVVLVLVVDGQPGSANERVV